jgi:hypothetical protein
MRLPMFSTFSAFILVGLALCLSAIAQDKKDDPFKNDDNHTQIRAKEIIDQAKKAITSKVDITKIKTLYLSYEGIYNAGVELTEKYEYSIDNFEKINRVSIVENKGSKSSIVETLSGSTTTIRENQIWAYGSKSSSEFRKITNTEDERVKGLTLQTSERILPILLELGFIKLSQFRFIGVAEAETGKADVIESVSTNKETIQLLFDQKTHRLLMMAKKFTNEGNSFEDNYYFSDYKENAGLMIPHKTTVKRITPSGANLFIESNLKIFKINPEFDAKIFEIKDK